MHCKVNLKARFDYEWTLWSTYILRLDHHIVGLWGRTCWISFFFCKDLYLLKHSVLQGAINIWRVHYCPTRFKTHAKFQCLDIHRHKKTYTIYTHSVIKTHAIPKTTKRVGVVIGEVNFTQKSLPSIGNWLNVLFYRKDLDKS